MTTQTAAGLFLALASFAAGQSATKKELPRIANPEVLAIEMAKALVSADRDRVTALAATGKEMETLLEAAQPPMRPEERKYQKDKVAEILADRRRDFDRFQAMKRKASFGEGVAVRFDLIALDPIYEKDGMKKIRHSRVRMLQGAQGRMAEAFIISLDDMFLFPRGWAFTSISPEIGKEMSRK
ncbi:MAG TPA: hypothetical protein VFX46_07945 [Hyphomicrobiaceae bacterium]|nr:hypothetical protein [Hyphomicrobiaceae bacterium]